MVRALTPPTQNRAEHAAQNLFANLTANRAGHPARGTFRGGFEDAFAFAAPRPGTAAEHFADAIEQAA